MDTESFRRAGICWVSCVCVCVCEEVERLLHDVIQIGDIIVMSSLVVVTFDCISANI